VHGEWEPRGVTVVLVNIREDRAKVARVVAQRGYAAPVALDLDGSVSEAYGIHATPMAFVVAPLDGPRRPRPLPRPPRPATLTPADGRWGCAGEHCPECEEELDGADT